MIIGDVHGCFEELYDLMVLEGDSEDTIIFAGDLVNKGRRSQDVVKLAAKRENTFCVLGNHDLYAIQAFKEGLELDWKPD